MTKPFVDPPVLNAPEADPARHWELDDPGQPTQRSLERRRAEVITPIPKPRKRNGSVAPQPIVVDEGQGRSTPAQPYDQTAMINAVRQQVEPWRRLPNPHHWHVTPETARLLQHWRHHPFSHIRPFCCQVEAVATVMGLTEVALNAGNAGKAFLEHLTNANHDANPELRRLALNLATGAGKTTVMARLSAWHTIHAVRRPNSQNFTRGFLIVTPGLTIRDRLRVRQPNAPDSYYASRVLMPSDLLGALARATLVITNDHAFRRRERMELSQGGRALLQGRGAALNTLETEGQMLPRVLPELMGLKPILVLNDDAQPCSREKPGQADDGDLTGDDRQEAAKEAARVWIAGLEVVARTRGVSRVIDLSATPFFLRGSGDAEGTPGRLGDAIRCVVSVALLTAGWDAHTVTHVRGVRAFGTPLLCEQVIGRALRRQSYDLHEEGLFHGAYADVLGVPCDFAAKPAVAPPQPPRQTIQVKAVRPDRDHREIRFPRVQGYRVELPEERRTPDLVGPSITRNAGIIGADVKLSRQHLEAMRRSTRRFHLTQRLLDTKWRDPGDAPTRHLLGQLKRLTTQGRDTCLVCKGGTYPAQLLYQELTDMAGERITAGITRALVGERPIKALLDPYNPTGSTIQVHFTTAKPHRWQSDPRRCHLTWGILDSDWEAECCRVAPTGEGLHQKPQPRPGRAGSLWLGDAHVSSGFDRAGG
jgi:hypothetical protein